jgi:hypothetical protein
VTEIEVLNGVAGIGDEVAFAYRHGNGAEICVGTVVAIVDRGTNRETGMQVYRIRVKARLDSSSWQENFRGVEVMRRVVKL